MIAELHLGSGGVGRVARPRSGPEVSVDGLDGLSDGSIRCLLRVVDGSPTDIGDAIQGWDGVTAARRVATCPDGDRLCVRIAADSPLTCLYWTMVAADGVFLSGSGRLDGFEVRLWFPDRDRFDEVRGAMAELGPRITVGAVSSGHPSPGHHPHGLSEPQRELLQIAHERGYFRVPRETTLGELATELGVSTQAASERLRRGLDSLLESTLAARRQEDPPDGSFTI